MKELGLGQLKLSCNRGEWTAGAGCLGMAGMLLGSQMDGLQHVRKDGW